VVALMGRLLLAAFTSAVMRVLARGEEVDCNCSAAVAAEFSSTSGLTAVQAPQ
jgi:hypothetical protein